MTLDGLRVVVADDHPVFRDGLIALLEARGATVVGVAADGVQVVTVVQEAEPDVVVMDIGMPQQSGVDATRTLVAAGTTARIVIATMYDDDESLIAAMRAGAAGYVLKGATPDELAAAVAQIAAGGLAFGRDVATRVQEQLTRSGSPASSPFPSLTERELEVLDLVAAGLDNAAIARRLGISHKTVKNHVSNVFTKLQVVDRAGAIIRARDAGLGRP